MNRNEENNDKLENFKCSHLDPEDLKALKAAENHINERRIEQPKIVLIAYDSNDSKKQSSTIIN